MKDICTDFLGCNPFAKSAWSGETDVITLLEHEENEKNSRNVTSFLSVT